MFRVFIVRCAIKEVWKHRNNRKMIENILFITATKIQYKNKRKSFSTMESSSFYYSFRVILTY
ncbi:hypothetical protein D3Z46_13525 [Bacteroides sartorii]|uniref:Uncharacterized protein n=1 Tax=Phocaeicola sartorii TaxID=671267 RepID=A0A4V3RTZ5_9BACT|nr:hypothetical protein [Phocaeicola sartorii]TGY72949.1 hypothetical protein E5339_01730 [Phocaeicola sartorii]